MASCNWIGLLLAFAALTEATVVSSPAGAAKSTFPGIAALRVQGTFHYEKVPVDRKGLRPGRKYPVPCAGVPVDLLNAAGAIVGSTHTDESGEFDIWADCALAGEFSLRAAARYENAEVRPDSQQPPYEIRSAPFVLVSNGAPEVRDLMARDRDRTNGPFNILACVETANRFLRAQVDPGISLPPTTFMWSKSHASYAAVVGSTIRLAGRRTANSDEFDDGIVLAAYGRRLLSFFDGDDDPGLGPSMLFPFDRLDPRVAWSQGWSYFFACACLGDPVILDTWALELPDMNDGDVESTQFVTEYNLESGGLDHLGHALSPSTGFDEPLSVAAVLWDLYDGPNDVDDSVTVDFRRLWLIATGPRQGSRFRYLLEYVDDLLRADPGLASAVGPILQQRGLNYPPQEVWPPDLPQVASGKPNVRGTIHQTRGDSAPARRMASDAYLITLSASSELTLALQLSKQYRGNQLRLRLLDSQANAVGWGITRRAARGNPSVALTLNGVAAGDYVVVVDAYDPQHGEFRPQTTHYSLWVSSGRAREGQ